MNKLWSIFLACTIALGSSDVLAKRLGNRRRRVAAT